MSTLVPRLLAISDRRSLPAGTSLADWASRLHAAEVPALQLREKDLTDRQLLATLEQIRLRVGELLTVSVNRRADLAIASGAAGVHLPADGLPVTALRRLFGPGLSIGRSCHSLEDVEEAATDGADYVTFGPVFETPSKLRYGPPQGLHRLEDAAGVGIPVVAIGGIEPQHLGQLASAGAWGAAAIRAFLEDGSCRQMVREARRHFGPVG